MLVTEENLQILSELKFDGIEIPASLQINPMQTSKEDRMKMKELVNSHGLKIVAANVIYPRGFLHTSEDEKIRRKSVEYTWKLAEAASEVEIPILVWGSGHARNIPQNLTREKGYEYNLSVLKEAAKAGSEFGVIFAIEPLSRNETNFINTIEEALDISEKVNSDSIKILADIRHMIREELDVEESFNRAKDKIVHIHLADNNGKVPGRGIIDFSKILRIINNINYNGYLSIEARLGENPKMELEFTKKYLVSVGGDLK